MPDFADLQAALQDAVIDPSTEGWAITGRLLAPSPMSAERRLSLYARGYRARLMDCLRGEFPALRALMGEAVFDLFAGGYIDACPPESHSLHALGARLPDWLERTRPPGVAPGDVEALPASLARLERAWSETLRARGPEGMVPPAPDALLDPSVRLRLPETTRLLALDFDFAPLMAAVMAGEPVPTPQARPCPTAIARAGWRVSLQPLTPIRFAWLVALGPDGKPGQAAAAEAAASLGQDPGAALADLILWLPVAAQTGLVVSA